jgi:transglutaminase-like putative cysteine protease
MKEPRPILLLLALLGLAAGCASRVFPFEPIDLDKLRSERGRVEQLMKEHKDHAAVFLLVEHGLEHDVELGTGHWSVRGFHILRYLVIDEKDKELTTFDRRLSKNFRIKRAEIVVLPPDGEPRRFTEADLVQEKATGKRVRYKLAYPAVTRGTIIEERWETVCADPLKAPVFHRSFKLRYSYPTLRVAGGFVCPKEWSLAIKKAAGKLDVDLYESKGKHVLIARRQNVPAQPDEVYSPYDSEDGDYLRVSVTGARTPSMVYYARTTWEKVAKSHLKYVVENDAVFSRRVARQSEAITKGITDPRARMEAIVGWVQAKIRVQEEWEEKDFADVLKSRCGRPWQITGLTHQLLRKAGLDSEFVMIHSAKDGEFDKQYVNTVEPDIGAVMVRIGDKTHLALPYLKGLPIGLIPGFLQGRPALRIGEEGFAGFTTTPVHGPDRSLTEERYSVKLSREGLLEVDEERLHHGLAAYRLREKLKDLKGKKLKDKLKKMLTYTEGKIDLKVARVEGRDDAKKPLRIVYHYTIDNLVTIADDEAVMQTAGLFSPSWQHKKIRARRLRPVCNHAARRYRRTITLRLPSGWSPEKLPADVSFRNRLGQVSTRYRIADDRLEVEQTRTMKRFHHPPGAAHELHDLLGKHKKLDVPTLVLRIGQPAADAKAAAAPR